MKEIWLPVSGYEGLYEVSNFGRVKSLGNDNSRKTKILIPCEEVGGYLKVCLCKNGKGKTFRIHRIVAEAFLPNWCDFQQVNHIDEDKTNNHVNNLEWCDRKYNINHGTRNERVAEKNTNGKLSKIVLQLTKTGELVREWPSTQEAERNGFNHGHIVSCCSGKLKSYKGYIWKYKEVV